MKISLLTFFLFMATDFCSAYTLICMQHGNKVHVGRLPEGGLALFRRYDDPTVYVDIFNKKSRTFDSGKGRYFTLKNPALLEKVLMRQLTTGEIIAFKDVRPNGEIVSHQLFVKDSRPLPAKKVQKLLQKAKETRMLDQARGK